MRSHAVVDAGGRVRLSYARLSYVRLLVLLRKELLDLARDRKVLYAAILLPALLFPLLVGFSGRLLGSAEKGIHDEPIRVGIVGKDRGIDRLVAQIGNATWARGGSQQKVRSGELDAVVLCNKNAGGPPRYTILHDSSRSSSRNATERLTDGLMRVTRAERSQRIARAAKVRALALDLPAREIEAVDLAVLQRGSRSGVPRFLPMLLVLIVLSAAAFAAIDLFPGERERGTLETLLTQPMQVAEVLAAKYVAVFLVGVVAVVANLAGMLMSSAVTSGSLASGLPVTSLAMIFVLSLPLNLFLSAFLVRVVARARSVREAQSYLLPLTMLCLLPPFMAGSPDVPFDGFTACLPLAGPALAFRETSVGRFDPLPLAMMLLSTLALSVLVLRGALKHLANEEHLLGDGSRGQQSAPRRAVMLVLFSILGLYALGPFFQGHGPLIGLGVPLMLFTGAPVLLLGRWAGMPPGELLRLGRAPARALATAACAGVGLALLSASIGTLQGHLLPLPQSFRDAAKRALAGHELSLPALLLLLAVLPALLEELLYRRFLLNALLKSQQASRALGMTAVLFALHHLSIFRFLPTLAAGLVLGWLVITTRTFWAAPLAHAISNAVVVLVLVDTSPLAGTVIATWVSAEHLALVRVPVGLALIVLPQRWLYRRDAWEPEPRAV